MDVSEIVAPKTALSSSRATLTYPIKPRNDQIKLHHIVGVDEEQTSVDVLESVGALLPF